jgi:hypothetical protein
VKRFLHKISAPEVITEWIIDRFWQSTLTRSRPVVHVLCQDCSWITGYTSITAFNLRFSGIYGSMADTLMWICFRVADPLGTQIQTLPPYC